MNRILSFTDDNYGGNSLYLNGRLVLSSEDEDVSINDDIALYWSDRLEILLLEPEFKDFEYSMMSGMRPGRKIPAYFNSDFGDDWEEFWPESEDDLYVSTDDGYVRLGDKDAE